jgi:transformer-2 protein
LGVFGLSRRTREDELKEKFGKYGKIEKVIIIYNQKTNESRCYGFVYFENLEDATSARKELNGIKLDEKTIRVDYSITQKAHKPTPGRYMGNIRRDNRRDYRSSYRRSYRSRSISRSRSRSRSSRHRRSRSRSLRRRRH